MTTGRSGTEQNHEGEGQAHQSSLLTKSPNPGVSTTVNLSLTLFSTISTFVSLCAILYMRTPYRNQSADVPAEMDSICTVLPLSWPGWGIDLGWYRGVSKRVLMSVDLPRPDSPV